MSDAAVAMNRFGLGATRGQEPPRNPKRWLLDQVDAYQPATPVLATAPTSAAVAEDIAAYQAEQRAIRQAAMAKQGAPAAAVVATPPPGPAMTPLTANMAATVMAPPSPAQEKRSAQQVARQDARRLAQDDYTNLVGLRTASALTTQTPFAERLVHFWSNHFATSADKLELIGLAGTLENEAIRPHVMGRFADMLFAVERHPAMLIYLDQAVSIGPDSPLGLRAKGRRRSGLNENLAREIMELHTLGVRTGYTQADVTEFARAMTGWTVGGIGGGPAARFVADRPVGSFAFVPQVHQPGIRTIMGKAYGQDGEAQASAVLTDLSVHPATARHIATKLARHFAGDNPPPAMVARLEKAFLSSRGDLPTVYRALIASPEAWAPAPAKFKTPWEWSVSSYRALGAAEVPAKAMQGLLDQLGQPMWKPGQPIGYDDTAASWAAPDAVLRRVEAAQRFASKAPPSIDARALAPQLFPAALSPMTAQALSRAESPTQALALLLVSPEMMRR
ncbi:DUF1800 domain-containing protein [Sphingomonas aquatilis]|uniref:Uncharacterized protein (DUF1800 family) n=1 Tax=Sphingomonas aquatilis TaxID=93063 RepID=A0AAW3TSZ3_9SPHN|nr:DUF1800 domain-containing protein [Sphingomonas aquatilis]MBB3875811.1 uncharacterized protein (DUF1800 family) [Sphingomonas aquatilis]